MYADYSYYTGTFYGSMISEADFPTYASKASDFIDYITYGKAKNNADLPEVKKCCCALAEQYSIIDASVVAAKAVVQSGGEIASETVGAHSRSFRSGAETLQGAAAAEAELGRIAGRYLLPTGLLYRGVKCVHTACCNSL